VYSQSCQYCTASTDRANVRHILLPIPSLILNVLFSDGTPQAVRRPNQHPKSEWCPILQDELILMYIVQVIKATERSHLWPELVFLYIKYDEFVSTFSYALMTYI
jgi:hypothetical protein